MPSDSHDWELKGGAFTKNSSQMGFGMALFQCRDCDLPATRALTARNESLNSVVPTPDVDETCPPGGDA